MHGIDEQDEESPGELTDKIRKEMFYEKMRVTPKGIEWRQRLGSPEENSLPVIKFLDYREKASALDEYTRTQNEQPQFLNDNSCFFLVVA